MVIVAGHIPVEPEQRESYLVGCMSVVEKARRADGCLDFAITADLLDPGRVNLFERWENDGRLRAEESWTRARHSCERRRSARCVSPVAARPR